MMLESCSWLIKDIGLKFGVCGTLVYAICLMSWNWVAFFIDGMLIVRRKREVPRALAARLFLKNVHVGVPCVGAGEPVHMHWRYPSSVLAYTGSVMKDAVFVTK